MLTTTHCRERHFGVLSTTMTTRVPKRCLFGVPNPKETIELLQETLELERTRFARRWGIDPREDKENLCIRMDRVERSPRKRNAPYARQNNLHDYWRSRKLSDVNKKSGSSNTIATEANTIQQQQQHQQNGEKMTAN